jgi:hypothetical protein
MLYVFAHGEDLFACARILVPGLLSMRMFRARAVTSPGQLSAAEISYTTLSLPKPSLGSTGALLDSR